jgi:hypothetical protein
MSKSEDDATPRGLRAEDIEKKRQLVEAKFGTRGWEEGKAMAKPHRCLGYLRDIQSTYDKTGEIWGPFKVLVSCLWSSPG